MFDRIPEAKDGIFFSHTSGTFDEVDIMIGTSPTYCTSSPSVSKAFVNVAASEPTDSSYFDEVHLTRGFTVIGGTPYSFYLNGLSVQGGAASFWWGQLKAVYYPY